MIAKQTKQNLDSLVLQWLNQGADIVQNVGLILVVMQPSGSSVSADVGSEQNYVVNNFLAWGRVAEVVLSGIERVDVVGLDVDREFRGLNSDSTCGETRCLGRILTYIGLYLM